MSHLPPPYFTPACHPHPKNTQAQQKVVFIKDAITDDVANNHIALSLHLDSLDQKRIYYWMNCPGGDVCAQGPLLSIRLRLPD